MLPGWLLIYYWKKSGGTLYPDGFHWFLAFQWKWNRVDPGWSRWLGPNKNAITEPKEAQGPRRTGRVSRFACKPFDVACNMCEPQCDPNFAYACCEVFRILCERDLGPNFYPDSAARWNAGHMDQPPPSTAIPENKGFQTMEIQVFSTKNNNMSTSFGKKLVTL